jgi:hypothetical protein
MGSLENLDTAKATNKAEARSEEAESKKEAAVGADLVKEAFGGPGTEAKKSHQGGAEAVKPEIDHNTIGGVFSAIGTVLTNPMKAAEALMTAADYSRSMVREVASLAALASPAAFSGLALTQVAVNKWENSDKSVSVEKKSTLHGEKGAAELDVYLDLFDKQVKQGPLPAIDHAGNVSGSLSIETTSPKAGSMPVSQLELDSDIYHHSESGDHSSDKNEKTHQYENARGEKAKVTVDKDSVHYTAEKDGQVVTDAWQLNGLSTINHKGETATLDTKAGKLELSSEQLRLLQQGNNQDIELKNGMHIKRNGDQLTICDGSGAVLQQLQTGALIVEDDVAVVQGDNLTDQAGRMNKDTINVVVSTEGHALAHLPGGIDIEVRNDNNAVIRTESGDVLLVGKDGKVYILDNGQFIKIPCGRRGAIDVSEDGVVRIGKLELSPGKGIQFDGGNIDLGTQAINFHNASRGGRRIQLRNSDDLKPAERGVTVTTDRQKIETIGVLIKTVLPPLQLDPGTAQREWSVDLNSQSFDSKELHISKEETRIKHDDGRADTVIKRDNSVNFDDGKGPIINKDGGMQFDERTHVDHRGNVTSGDWHAATGYSNTQSKDTTTNSSSAESAASTVANHGSSTALSVYGKASSGSVTMSDIDALSQSLSDVTALISQLAALGRNDLVGQLQNTCGLIAATISYALPKAKAGEAMTQQNAEFLNALKQLLEERNNNRKTGTAA